jgi:hypothetical protein
MCALSEGVHPGIGSSGAVNTNSLATDMFKLALKMILNRIAMGLALPPRKSSPVVCNDQFQPSRHRNLARCFLGMRHVLSPVEISLQNHLSCYLVHIAAGMARFFAGLSQRAVRRNRGQPLVPRDDWARKNRSQFFYELESFGCGGANCAAHLTRNSHNNVIDFLFTNNRLQPRGRLLSRWDRLERMRQ